MQTSLFDVGAPEFDARLPGLRRIELGDGAWVDHVPRAVRGHAALFRQLRDGLDWIETEREMYERTVRVPRLLATLPTSASPSHNVPKLLYQLAHVLSRRYGQPLHQLSAAMYRDGSDSVAPHGDRVASPKDAVIATLSLGHPRRFLLRHADPGRTTAHDFVLGWGDVLVMGGTCQSTWRHAIPKCAAAGPRISVQYRPDPPSHLPPEAQSR